MIPLGVLLSRHLCRRRTNKDHAEFAFLDMPYERIEKLSRGKKSLLGVMMLRSGKALMALVFLACASPCQALTFSFSFTDSISGAGLVEGTISGLLDNQSNQQATSVFVNSAQGGFGEGEYVGAPATNQFTVVNGVITRVGTH
jgi:hypothetical protein